MPQSLDIGKNSDGCTFNFRISGQAVRKENFHNSKKSGDIDMILGPAAKLDKGNKPISKKKNCDYVLSANYDIIVIFPN